jgi:hypothetical protein
MACGLPLYLGSGGGPGNNNCNNGSNNNNSSNNGSSSSSDGGSDGGNRSAGDGGSGNNGCGNGNNNNGNNNNGNNNNGNNNNGNNNNGNNNNGNNNNGSNFPSITSVSPNQVRPGDTLTIMGSGFNEGPISVNTSAGACNVGSSTATMIACITPMTIPSNDYGVPITVMVQTSQGQTSRDNAFEFELPAPAITGFMPDTVRWGDMLTINGSYLQQMNLSVQFAGGGTPVPPMSSGMNSIQVTVPMGAQSGPVTLMYEGGTVASTMSLTVLQVAIASFSPAAARILDPVTITGYGFMSGMMASIGGTPIDLSHAQINATSCTFRVPVGAATGVISVQLGQSMASSMQPLVITGGTVIATGNDLVTNGDEQSSTTLTAFPGASDEVLTGYLLFTSGPNMGEVGTLVFLLDPTDFYTREMFQSASGQGYMLVQ